MNNLNNSKIVVDFSFTKPHPKFIEFFENTVQTIYSKPDASVQFIKLNGLIKYLSGTKFKHPVINLTQFKDICNNLHLEFYQFSRFLATKYKIPLLLTDYDNIDKQTIIQDNKQRELKRQQNKTKKNNKNNVNNKNSRNKNKNKT